MDKVPRGTTSTGRTDLIRHGIRHASQDNESPNDSRAVETGLLSRYSSGAFICFDPRGLTRLPRCSCSGHNTVNGAGIGCADHTPSMLDVLLLVVHRTLLVFAWTGT